MSWQPIETAPKGGGAKMVTDPKWVQPPDLLLWFPEEEKQAVCYWDWAFAEGGRYHNPNVSAWILVGSDERAAYQFGEPTYWAHLPEPPEQARNETD